MNDIIAFQALELLSHLARHHSTVHLWPGRDYVINAYDDINTYQRGS